MLLEQNVQVKLIPKTHKWYTSKGYTGKLYEYIEVDIKDLTLGSLVYIDVECDYCKNIFQKKYNNYNNEQKNSIIKKNCCENCRQLKVEESLQLKYGVDNINKLDSTSIKRKQTNLDKYGVDNPMQVVEFKNKQYLNNYLKYGVQHNSQLEGRNEKCIQTSLEHYGCESPMQSIEVKNKLKQTCLERFGVDNPLKSFDVRKKMNKTLNKNGTAPTSRQQIYVNSIFKGELNYPEDRSLLDIAFPDDKLYVECDFGGHNLQVKLGKITQDEFDKKERVRSIILNRKGWKEMRIISTNDKLPSDLIIFYMLQFAKSYLSTGHSWIKFDIDNNKVITSQYEKQFKFGKLRKISKKNIEQIA